MRIVKTKMVIKIIMILSGVEAFLLSMQSCCESGHRSGKPGCQHLPFTNVLQVQFTDTAPYMGFVIAWMPERLVFEMP